MKARYIYEVYFESPIGSWPLGFYRKKEEAYKAKLKWDKKHSSELDKAFVTRHTLR